MKEGEQNAELSGRQRRKSQYKRELALPIYKKHGLSPPVARDELEYTGGAKDLSAVVDMLICSGKHLSDGAKMAWLAIFRHNWDSNQTYRVSWQGREKIAIITGKSVRQTSIYLRELRDKRLLLTKRRAGKPALYLLNDPPKEWMEETLKKLKEKKT